MILYKLLFQPADRTFITAFSFNPGKRITAQIKNQNKKG
jgi:hypothetical protein